MRWGWVDCGRRGGGWYLVCKHDGSVTKINVRQSNQHCRSCLSRAGSARAVNLRPDFFWCVCVSVCVCVYTCLCLPACEKTETANEQSADYKIKPTY